MSETQQPQPCVSENEGRPIDAPLRPWTLRAAHRHPAVAWLIVVLIVLQLVLGGVVVVQAWRLLDLGERIERLGKQQPIGSE